MVVDLIHSVSLLVCVIVGALYFTDLIQDYVKSKVQSDSPLRLAFIDVISFSLVFLLLFPADLVTLVLLSVYFVVVYLLHKYKSY